MKVQRTLRLISLVMLIVAVVYTLCTLSNATLDVGQMHTLLKVEIDIGRSMVYAFVMVALFVASFFVKSKE